MGKGFLGSLMPALMGGGFHQGGAFTVPPRRVGEHAGGEVIVSLSTPSGARPSWVEEAFRQHQADIPFIGFDLAAEEPFTPPATIAGERYCATCGCTQFDACTHPDHGACWWTGPNECSHCKYGWGDANG